MSAYVHLDPSTSTLLAALETFSQHKLTRRNDLGTLIELAFRHDKRTLLDDLSFLAKFVSRSHGIMKRIGRDGEGYDKLSHQFGENLERATTLLRTLVKEAPEDVKSQFASTYFTMTQDAMQNLLALFYDLSWYKNWRIDHPEESV